ncbi:MAG: hypothetical protein WBI92_11735, partial [Cloacibacterium sp.]|uniref:hypothetical protein n=1 Tax=Cloacibacterium sp. TaxID=1913682 RepID=UPI003C77ECC0
MSETSKNLLRVALAYKEYIDALPKEVVASLPAMPGIDGDWASEVLDRAAKPLTSKYSASALATPPAQADSQPAPVVDGYAATLRAQNDQFEHALAELVDLVCPGLDSGNLLVDAKTAGDAAQALRAARAPADSVKKSAVVVGPDGMMRDELRSMIEGMSVSVDVSTGDHDAG